MAFCNAIICNFCCRLSFTFMPPPPQGGRHYRLSGAVCPSVRLSVVCGVPWLNSRTERPRKPKIDRLVARHACIPWSYLEVKRSKVKVTRPVDAHTVNAQYLPNVKAYELQTLCTDGDARRPALAIIAVMSKVKGQGRKVTWRVWQVLADKSRMKRLRNTEITRKVVHPTANSSKVKRSKVKLVCYCSTTVTWSIIVPYRTYNTYYTFGEKFANFNEFNYGMTRSKLIAIYPTVT